MTQMASEEQAKEACKYLRTIIEAAENSNQAGENAAVRAADAVRLRRSKDEGLIASEADFLNTELRMNYGGHLQVDVNDDWRMAIRGLVDGVRYGEEFNRRNKEGQVVKP